MDVDADESLELGSRTWKRIVNAAVKTGYREGVDEGSKAVLQADFDKGYEDGFKVAFVLGKYKALASHILNDVQHPPEIIQILEATRRGGCHICKVELQAKNFDAQDIEDHKQHVKKTLKMLHDYFEPILNYRNLDLSSMSID